MLWIYHSSNFNVKLIIPLDKFGEWAGVGGGVRVRSVSTITFGCKKGYKSRLF